MIHKDLLKIGAVVEINCEFPPFYRICDAQFFYDEGDRGIIVAVPSGMDSFETRLIEVAMFDCRIISIGSCYLRLAREP